MNQPSARMAKSRECSDNDNDKDRQDNCRVRLSLVTRVCLSSSLFVDGVGCIFLMFPDGKVFLLDRRDHHIVRIHHFIKVNLTHLG